MADPQGDLFAQPRPRTPRKKTALQVGMEALERTASRPKNQALIEQLVPLAQELAREARLDGITCTDLRAAAERRGILTGQEETHFLGAVMRAAGLRNTQTFRRSSRESTHGRPQYVWTL